MRFARGYVRVVDGMNRGIGRAMMYGLFALMGILLWSSVSKVFFSPAMWTLEMAQFAMVAYYILGGPYSIQMGSNVRMDLFYHDWPVKKKAAFDAVTVFFLIFYLGVLIWGAVDSFAYSLGHFRGEPWSFLGQVIHGFVTGGVDGAAEVIGRPERSPSPWRPYQWPIKLVMLVGFVLMLLQAVSELLKDIMRLNGEDIPDVV